MYKLFFCLVLFLFFLFEAHGKELEQRVVIPYVEAPFCQSLKDDIFNEKYQEFKKINVNKRNLFVGEDIFKYNSNDFYLSLYSYDVQGDGVEDIIAVDFIHRSRNVYYMAYYFFPGVNIAVKDKNKAKSFFMNTKIHPRHKGGVRPLFPEYFYIDLGGGSLVDENFVGYSLIEPLRFYNKNFIYAEKKDDLNRRGLLFDVEGSGKLSILCII